MPLSVTNTLTGDREAFEPTGDDVLLYVCGLTVSDDPHLGHARLWTHADVIHRWLAVGLVALLATALFARRRST